VFANNAGSVQLKKVFPKILKRVCDRAGVPVMLWGDFRHFFASVQISSLGEDWGEVAALMGHANSAFTYRQYGHYVRNVEKQKQVTSATAAAMGI
jgi:integrase